MMYHTSPHTTLETPLGTLNLTATDGSHVYLSTEHRPPADDHVTVNGVDYWATLHIYARGTRRAYWSGESGEHANVTSESWETHLPRDAYMSRGVGEDASDAARKKFTETVLHAADDYLNTPEGIALLVAAEESARINEANKRAARVAALSARINEERRALRRLTKAGYPADDDAGNESNARAEAVSMFRGGSLRDEV